jgi:PUA domain protein
MSIKNRHRLKNKDIKKLQNELKNIFDTDFFDANSSVETGEYEGIKILFVDGEPSFMFYDGNLVFTLHGLNKFKPKKKLVVVDMGAVKFVTSGADVMAPGIVDADENIVENDQVWICDENHHKPLAVGIALMAGEQMKSGKSGKAIKTIHYVGDMLWNFPAKSL